jgi:hypothetical protein
MGRSMGKLKGLGTSLVVTSALAACRPPMAVPALTARESAVGVDRAPPPPGSRKLGEVLGEHGSGCGFTGQKGTYAGAAAVLRDRTAAMGGDYAEVVSVDPPIHTTDCLANRWAIHALAYRTPSAAPVAAPPAPAVTSVPPLTSAPPPSAPGCAPPCSPGYACSSAGTCRALCNPTCGPGQVCRQDRTCGPPP